MLIWILADDFPGTSCGPSPDEPGGYTQIRVGVQVRNKPSEVVDLVAGNARWAQWRLDCEAVVTPEHVDIRGRHIQGRPGARFVYLSWVYRHSSGEDRMFRRAKLMLDAVPDATLRKAARTGVLEVRVGLTDPKGRPTCAAMRPPDITWTAISGSSALEYLT